MTPDLRYDVKIDVSSGNTSHAIVLEMVGYNCRVLDIGCSTGAVGEVLVARGCEVVGVESDAAAAGIAHSRLTEVVVGDVESLPLRDRYGGGSFDVVIVADVLEHLTDPTAVLRALVPLLRPNGSVVVSLPNIAHGAVRLALLEGRFDYTDVGLLDRTHLRFFTAESATQLLREAGLVPVEFRRTTAGVFDTEISIDPKRFPAELIAQVESDPEAMTYQFVIKAVRDDASHSIALLQSERRELEQRLEATETALAAISKHGAPNPPASARWPPGARQVAIWGFADSDDPFEALSTAVHVSELRRRLLGDVVRAFAPYGWKRATATVLPVPLEPLGRRSDDRVDEVLAQLDCVVIVGRLSARLDELTSRYGPVTADLEHPATFLVMPPVRNTAVPRIYSGTEATVDPSRDDDSLLLHALATAAMVGTPDERLARILEGTAGDVRIVPDPLVLVSRLSNAGHVRAARAAIRTSGARLDEVRYLVIHGDGEGLDDVPLILQVVERFRREQPDVIALVVNFAGTDRETTFASAIASAIEPHLELRQALSVIDVLAVLEGAAAVLTTADSVASVARSLGVRVVLHNGSLGALADTGALITASVMPPPHIEHEVAALDRYFDDVCAFIAALPVAEVASPFVPPERLAAAEAAAEAASASARRAAGELLSRIEALQAEVLDRSSAYPSAPGEDDVNVMRQQLAAAQAELAALRRTKAVRLATSLRRLARSAADLGRIRR